MGKNNMKEVIDAARLGMAAQKIFESDSQTYFFLPHPIEPKTFSINTEVGEGCPFRKRGTVQVFDAASFNAILATNYDAGNITIYINRDADAPSIVAVLNGSGEGGPGWGDYRAEILFRFTPQWKRWKAIDGKMLPQLAFAEFVEDNLGDIASPPGAEMLEIAQYLSATRSLDFKSGVRMSDGRVQLTNVESIDAKVGSGQTAIPTSITLGIAPVFGIPPFSVEARFRYRIDAGKLALGIKLQRVEDIMAAVVNDMVNGTVATENRPSVAGIVAPQGAVIVEGIAPGVTK